MYVAKICLNLESIETHSNNRNTLQNSKIEKKVTSLTYCLINYGVQSCSSLCDLPLPTLFFEKNYAGSFIGFLPNNFVGVTKFLSQTLEKRLLV